MGGLWLGFFIFPLLMAGGSDVVLYIGGLSMLCYGCWKFYLQLRFNQELKNITKE